MRAFTVKVALALAVCGSFGCAPRPFLPFHFAPTATQQPVRLSPDSLTSVPPVAPSTPNSLAAEVGLPGAISLASQLSPGQSTLSGEAEKKTDKQEKRCQRVCRIDASGDAKSQKPERHPHRYENRSYCQHYSGRRGKSPSPPESEPDGKTVSDHRGSSCNSPGHEALSLKGPSEKDGHYTFQHITGQDCNPDQPGPGNLVAVQRTNIPASDISDVETEPPANQEVSNRYRTEQIPQC